MAVLPLAVQTAGPPLDDGVEGVDGAEGVEGGLGVAPALPPLPLDDGVEGVDGFALL